MAEIRRRRPAHRHSAGLARRPDLAHNTAHPTITTQHDDVAGELSPGLRRFA
eukprot:COSAG01_NODE_37151_length_507_cov_12.191176_1_plen_51_part_01